MSRAIAVVAICAVVTMALRALPFVCFGGKKGVPRLVAALSETLPPAIMAALVIYCHRENIHRLLHGTAHKFRWHVNPINPDESDSE